MGFRVMLTDNDKVVMKLYTHDAVEAKSFLKVACREMHQRNETLDSMGFDMDDICADAWDPRKAPISMTQGHLKVDGRKA